MLAGRQHPRSSRRNGAKVVAIRSYASGKLLRDARIVTALGLCRSVSVSISVSVSVSVYFVSICLCLSYHALNELGRLAQAAAWRARTI